MNGDTRNGQRKVLLGELDDVEFELFALQPGLGASHPQVQQLVAQSEAILHQLDAIDEQDRADRTEYLKSPLFTIRSAGRIRPSQVDQKWVDDTFSQLTGCL